MKITYATHNEIWPTRHEYHVLTYAEEGFSPLNMHTKDDGFTQRDLKAFENQVSLRNEVGSLYPRSKLSAVPRSDVRDTCDPTVLSDHIVEFLRANNQQIKAKKIIFDFGTPSVQSFMLKAMELALLSPEAATLDEVVIIK